MATDLSIQVLLLCSALHRTAFGYVPPRIGQSKLGPPDIREEFIDGNQALQGSTPPNSMSEKPKAAPALD